MIQDIADPLWLGRATLDAAFEALVAAGLEFRLRLVTPRHLELLRRRLLKHPALRAVLDHAGKPDIAAGVESPAFRGMGIAARAGWARETPTCCKLSGLLTEAKPEGGAGRAGSLRGTCLGLLWAQARALGAAIAGADAARAATSGGLKWRGRCATAGIGAEQAVFAGNALRFYRLGVVE